MSDLDLLLKDYRHLAIAAEAYGFSYKDIDYLVTKSYLELRHLRSFDSIDIVSVALRALIARLNLEKEEFFKYIESVKIDTQEDMGKLKEKVGIRQVPILYALSR